MILYYLCSFIVMAGAVIIYCRFGFDFIIDGFNRDIDGFNRDIDVGDMKLLVVVSIIISPIVLMIFLIKYLNRYS